MAEKKEKKAEKADKPSIDLIGKIRGLRGMFYRKAADIIERSQEPETPLPGFSIGKTEHIVEFPDVKDPTRVNITYPLIEPFAYANVKWNPSTKEIEYLVVEPKLNEEEEKTLQTMSSALIELVEVGFSAIKKTDEAVPYLQEQVKKVVRNLGLKMTDAQYVKMMYYIYKNFVGFNEIEPFLQDPNIEDISCDGVETPLFIIHRKFGSVKTNVSFRTLDELREFIVKLAERAGRYVSYAEPILDGTLPDGSRVAATLAGDVATRGPTFTIRKFSEKPFSPVDQMELKTADADILAYFWYLIEHGASVLVVGGVATGKTSLLNTISMFILPEAKIVSIEDTREIRIPHEHWIAGLARSGFGVPSATGQKYGEVTLFDLLKESFRQNPDYVIVGEVRGAETYVMFQGMSSGHPSLSTFHAGSVDSVIKRLTSPPIELSPSLIESLDVVVVMIHAREQGKSARRVKEVSEIVSVDTKTQEVKTNLIFRWDPTTDTFVKVNDSVKVEKFAIARGGELEDALREIEDRKKVLQWLGRTGRKDFVEVAKYINMYFKEKRKLFEIMGQGASLLESAGEKESRIARSFGAKSFGKRTPERQAKVAPAFEDVGEVKSPESRLRKKRASVLELLGMRVLREK